MFKISFDEKGNMIAKQGGLYAAGIFSVCLVAGLFFLVISFFMFKQDGFTILHAPFIVFGLFFLWGAYAIFNSKLYYIFDVNTNKVLINIKDDNNNKGLECDYYHVDLVKKYNRAYPYYGFVVFLDHNKHQYVILDHFQRESTVRKMKKFCVEILEKSINYKPPEDTLEKQTFGPPNLSRTIAEMARIIVRAMR